MESSMVKAALAKMLRFLMFPKRTKQGTENPTVKKASHEKYIILSDVSSMNISFRDAKNHFVEEIIQASKAADRINRLLDE
jgi:hypothetical protein